MDIQQQIQLLQHQVAPAILKINSLAPNQRRLSCILFVLEVLAPFSLEFYNIRERVTKLQITDVKSLIVNDYIRKFVKTTRLEMFEFTGGAYCHRPLLLPGDILLLIAGDNGSQINHLGLYLGEDKYIHLKRKRTAHNQTVISNVSDNKDRIKMIVRGKLQWEYMVD